MNLKPPYRTKTRITVTLYTVDLISSIICYINVINDIQFHSNKSSINKGTVGRSTANRASF